jgi:hypothetical protein
VAEPVCADAEAAALTRVGFVSVSESDGQRLSMVGDAHNAVRVSFGDGDDSEDIPQNLRCQRVEYWPRYRDLTPPCRR